MRKHAELRIRFRPGLLNMLALHTSNTYACSLVLHGSPADTVSLYLTPFSFGLHFFFGLQW